MKGYLEEKNKKDIKIITNVIGHIKKNIKKVLSKVFNFSSGLGRYFNRWRKKDPHFNEILIK